MNGGTAEKSMAQTQGSAQRMLVATFQIATDEERIDIRVGQLGDQVPAQPGLLGGVLPPERDRFDADPSATGAVRFHPDLGVAK